MTQNNELLDQLYHLYNDFIFEHGIKPTTVFIPYEMYAEIEKVVATNFRDYSRDTFQVFGMEPITILGMDIHVGLTTKLSIKRPS